MLKNIIFIFVITLLLLIYLKPGTIKTHKPLLLQPEHLITEASPVYKDIVNNINSQYSTIKNIIYPEVSINLEGIKLESKILYEKKLRFHMSNRSFLGKEADIGSNDEYFWFWSKRLDPPAIYYAKHSDLSQTRLKTPFHPLWMMEILGINPILGDYKIFQHQNNLAVVQRTISVMNEPVKRIYLINPEKMAILGHYIYDDKDQLVVSAEILDFYKIDKLYFPKLLLIKWPEEDVELTWKLNTPIINTTIDKDNWECQLLNKNKINLKGYLPILF